MEKVRRVRSRRTLLPFLPLHLPKEWSTTRSPSHNSSVSSLTGSLRSRLRSPFIAPRLLALHLCPGRKFPTLRFRRTWLILGWMPVTRTLLPIQSLFGSRGLLFQRSFKSRLRNMTLRLLLGPLSSEWRTNFSGTLFGLRASSRFP